MTRLSLIAAAAAVAIAAGCGEDQSFIDDYNAATKPLQTLASDINSAVGGTASKDDAALGKEFERLADETKKTNDKLDDLEAPDDAKAPFDDLKAALRKGEADLREVAAAAKKGDAQAAQAAVQKLSRDGAAISRAETAVASKVE
jgi:flagellar capping protein FliD